MSKSRSQEPRPSEQYGGRLRPRHRGRLRVMLAAFVVVYGVIAFRLYEVQLHPDVKYSRVDLKHIGEIEIPVPRGTIYDRNGTVLAVDKTVYSLWADPRKVEDPDAMAHRLAVALHVNEAEMRARLAKTDAQGNTKMFVWIRRWMAPQEAAALGDLTQTFGPGLYLRPEPLRYYPQGDLAAHLLGYVSLDRVGRAGIELLCDKYLSSKPGRRVSRTDGLRNLLPSLTLEYDPPEGGADVHLTIDAAIQHSLDRELDKALVRAKAPHAMGMVMDPKTGAVLAAACRPGFDPNRYWEYTAQQRMNRVFQYAFEPGSSFKIVTASAALELNIVTPNYPINCMNGSFNPYGHRIHDFHAMGIEPFWKCFADSSNIALVQVAAWLGPARLDQWIRRFGFGRRTSPDFIYEHTGIYRPRKDWSRFSMGALPIGQEISVTVPQLARAFSVIANGGYLVQPYLVECAVGRDGIYLYKHESKPPVRIISQKTADTMKKLCHLVTSNGGTAPLARIKEYQVGGKTGTGQIAEPGRGYVPGKFTDVFAGFAPLSNPRVVCVIVVQAPAIALHYGGYVCGPVFSHVVRDALIRMNVPPDPEPDESKSKTQQKPAPPPTGDADTVVADSDDSPNDPVLTPLQGLELVRRTEDSSHGGPVLPDLRGLTKSEALARVAELGLQWDAEGAGWVASQSPPPGTPLREVTLCRLVFSSEHATKASAKTH